MRRNLSNMIALAADPVVERRALLVILIVAAVLRLALAPVVAGHVGYLPDVLSYRGIAADMLAGRLIENDLGMPGYPIMILLTGGGGLGQLLADIAFSVLAVWCIARIAKEITGDALAGLLAALLWAVYPFSIFYAVTGLSETFFVTLFLLGFLGYQRGKFTLGSTAMVAAILTRPSIEPLTPILILTFAIVVHRLSFRTAMKHLGIFAAIYVVLMAPWWWHNYEKYGRFVRLNLGSGMVLYSGNYPGNLDGGGVNFSIDVPGYYDIKDPIERDRALRNAAVRFIVENPGRFVELAGLKFMRIWRPWPYAAEYSSAFLSVVSAASFIPILLPAFAGVFWGARRYGAKLIPIGLFIGYTTAVHMVTIGSLRYRFPMEPFLVILAASPLAWLVRHFLQSGGLAAAAKGQS